MDEKDARVCFPCRGLFEKWKEKKYILMTEAHRRLCVDPMDGFGSMIWRSLLAIYRRFH
jgi:hypothetical protein